MPNEINLTQAQFDALYHMLNGRKIAGRYSEYFTTHPKINTPLNYQDEKVGGASTIKALLKKGCLTGEPEMLQFKRSRWGSSCYLQKPEEGFEGKLVAGYKELWISPKGLVAYAKHVNKSGHKQSWGYHFRRALKTIVKIHFIVQNFALELENYEAILDESLNLPLGWKLNSTVNPTQKQIHYEATKQVSIQVGTDYRDRPQYGSITLSVKPYGITMDRSYNYSWEIDATQALMLGQAFMEASAIQGRLNAYFESVNGIEQ